MRTQRCLRELAYSSRQVTGGACFVALHSCGTDRTSLHTMSDRWCPPGVEHSCHHSDASSMSSLAHSPPGWHALQGLEKRRYVTIQDAGVVPAAAAHVRRQGRVLGEGIHWSLEQGWCAALGRGFATEGSQSPAEKFDLIRQEPGAVRVEGCVPHCAPNALLYYCILPLTSSCRNHSSFRDGILLAVQCDLPNT